MIAFPVENRPVIEESDDVSMSRVAVKFADVVRKPKMCLKQLGRDRIEEIFDWDAMN